MNIQFSRNKAIVTMITILLLVSIAAPLVKAHDPPLNVVTTTYVSIKPSTVGIGQEALIIVWNRYTVVNGLNTVDRWTFYVDVTAPDGTNQTLGPITSDPVGSAWTTLTPDQVGTYRVIGRFIEHKISAVLAPGQTSIGIYGASVNDTYLASTSDPAYVFVQEDPIQGWVESPLPTEYWTRPINSMSRDWYQVAGNCLGGNAQVTPSGSYSASNPARFGYGPAPESAHVLWATPMWMGGIGDARFESGQAMWMGKEYTDWGSVNVIIDGKIYYTRNIASYDVNNEIRCLNLYTGEEIKDNFRALPGSTVGTIAFAEMLNYHSMNVHGIHSYLWVTNTGITGQWDAYDPFTNKKTLVSICNVTMSNPTRGATGTQVVGKDGSITYYNVANLGTTTAPNRYLQIWNSTVNSQQGPARSTALINGTTLFALNVSVPDVVGTIYAIRESDLIIGGSLGQYKYDRQADNSYDGTPTANGYFWALNLNASKGTVGALLWNVSFVPPNKPTSAALTSNRDGDLSLAGISPELGIFTFSEDAPRLRYTYSLATGQLLWTSQPEDPFQFYRMSTVIYDGKIISYGYGGKVIAYDPLSGDILWMYNATAIGFESPYVNYPLSLGCYADGKLYFTSGEHSPTQPFWRGADMRCIDADTGAELWKISDWVMSYSDTSQVTLADGILVSINSWDARIYGFGKGASTTTVDASPAVSTQGSSVIVKGTVTDISPGIARQTELTTRFPNGVPAMSDADQQAWMEYVWMNQARPTNAKGVDVVISVLDPNNNFYQVGTATSDESGLYSVAFTPQVPGKYTVITTFAGSKSYYGSYAETAINVDAPIATATPQPTPVPSMADVYFLPVSVAIIIAIVAVGALLLLVLLRKRP